MSLLELTQRPKVWQSSETGEHVFLQKVESELAERHSASCSLW